MDGVLDKTNWIIGGHNRVINVLRAMGVKVKSGGFFWRTNEYELEYIYNDFRKRERQLKARYHPDRKDGDAEIYRQLVNDCDLVRRQMERRGVIKISAAERQERKELAHERHKARNRFRMSNPRARTRAPSAYPPRRPRNRPHVPLGAIFTPEEVTFLSKEELLRRRKRRNKAQWRMNPANAEKERQAKKRWWTNRVETPEQKEHRNAYMRNYIKRPERIVKTYRASRAYRLAHPEKVKKWKKNYYEKIKGRPRFRKYPEGRTVKGSPAYERRCEWRKERWATNREENRRKRRAWYAAKRGAKYKQPRVKDHKGRFLPALEAAA